MNTCTCFTLTGSSAIRDSFAAGISPKIRRLPIQFPYCVRDAPSNFHCPAYHPKTRSCCRAAAVAARSSALSIQRAPDGVVKRPRTATLRYVLPARASRIPALPTLPALFVWCVVQRRRILRVFPPHIARPERSTPLTAPLKATAARRRSVDLDRRDRRAS